MKILSLDCNLQNTHEGIDVLQNTLTTLFWCNLQNHSMKVLMFIYEKIKINQAA